VVPFVSNVAGGVSNTVGVSPAWQTYHIPIIGVSCFVVGILGTLLVGSLWSWIKLKLFQRKQPVEEFQHRQTSTGMVVEKTPVQQTEPEVKLEIPAELTETTDETPVTTVEKEQAT